MLTVRKASNLITLTEHKLSLSPFDMLDRAVSAVLMH